MRTLKTITAFAFAAILVSGCGGTAEILATPVENIDNTPLKVSELTEAEKHNWGHLDLVKDTIPGMSVDKAYAEIIKNKKGKKIIVAVIDSGIDIDHEDLNNVLWTNTKETPNNGIDDDNNGYIDDIHGWNFLGDGYDEQLEFIRILAHGDTSNPDYSRALTEYDKEYEKYTGYKGNYEKIYEQIKSTDIALTKHFEKEDYTKAEVNAIKTEDEDLKKAIQVAKYMYSNGMDSMADAKKEISNGIKRINERLNYNLNKTFKGRVTGDNPDDMSTTSYGNGNVKPVKKSESHGTHVAGIIAAERNNGKGANGVANNVALMSIKNGSKW